MISSGCDYASCLSSDQSGLESAENPESYCVGGSRSREVNCLDEFQNGLAGLVMEIRISV